jgi:ubiquinone/menaquinone biosynthesis C-methylase UbiE
VGQHTTGSGAKDYQQRRYRSVDQALVNWREQRIIEALLTSCQLRGGSLLDVPCGYGRFTPLFARLGIMAMGADVRRAMVCLARENQPGPEMSHWLQANIFALPFADNAFDCVLSIRLLHHYYSDAERIRIVRELARVSRRFVVLSVYHATPLHTLVRSWRRMRSRLSMLTTAEFQELIQASGLHLWRQRALCRWCHAQTFVVLRKSASPGRLSQEMV